jgi:hypothetical protein
MNLRGTLTREEVVFDWLRMSISDFFFAFRIDGPFVRYAPFFNAMGFELMCKAYLLGCRASDYETLSDQEAARKVYQIARKELAHKLSDIIADIKNRKPSGKLADILSKKFDGFSGREFVKTLEAAYLECRYPMPERIYRKFPFAELPGMYEDPIYSSGLRKFCYATAREILTYISDDFSIKVPRTFLGNLRPKTTYKRFRRLFFADQAKLLIGRKQVS